MTGSVYSHSDLTLQVEFHPYWHEDALVKFCREKNITFNGYSPLGARDVSPARFVSKKGDLGQGNER